MKQEEIERNNENRENQEELKDKCGVCLCLNILYSTYSTLLTIGARRVLVSTRRRHRGVAAANAARGAGRPHAHPDHAPPVDVAAGGPRHRAGRGRRHLE